MRGTVQEQDGAPGLDEALRPAGPLIGRVEPFGALQSPWTSTTEYGCVTCSGASQSTNIGPRWNVLPLTLTRSPGTQECPWREVLAGVFSQKGNGLE